MSEVEEEPLYEVEVVSKAKRSGSGKGAWEYFVHWVGYPASDNSWEPSKNLAQCDHVLERFWDHVGPNKHRPDWPKGKIISAKPQWTSAQKKMRRKLADQQKQSEVDFPLDAQQEIEPSPRQDDSMKPPTSQVKMPVKLKLSSKKPDLRGVNPSNNHPGESSRRRTPTKTGEQLQSAIVAPDPLPLNISPTRLFQTPSVSDEQRSSPPPRSPSPATSFNSLFDGDELTPEDGDIGGRSYTANTKPTQTSGRLERRQNKVKMIEPREQKLVMDSALATKRRIAEKERIDYVDYSEVARTKQREILKGMSFSKKLHAPNDLADTQSTINPDVQIDVGEGSGAVHATGPGETEQNTSTLGWDAGGIPSAWGTGSVSDPWNSSNIAEESISNAWTTPSGNTGGLTAWATESAWGTTTEPGNMTSDGWGSAQTVAPSAWGVPAEPDATDGASNDQQNAGDPAAPSSSTPMGAGSDPPPNRKEMSEPSGAWGVSAPDDHSSTGGGWDSTGWDQSINEKNSGDGVWGAPTSAWGVSTGKDPVSTSNGWGAPPDPAEPVLSSAWTSFDGAASSNSAQTSGPAKKVDIAERGPPSASTRSTYDRGSSPRPNTGEPRRSSTQFGRHSNATPIEGASGQTSTDHHNVSTGKRRRTSASLASGWGCAPVDNGWPSVKDRTASRAQASGTGWGSASVGWGSAAASGAGWGSALDTSAGGSDVTTNGARWGEPAPQSKSRPSEKERNAGWSRGSSSKGVSTSLDAASGISAAPNAIQSVEPASVNKVQGDETRQELTVDLTGELVERLSHKTNGSNCAFCAWWIHGDGGPMSQGMETRMLVDNVQQCGAEDVVYEAQVDVIFVHVAALAGLHKMPTLAEKRADYSTSFFSYGSHASIPRERWGIKEIYSLGGLLTFTPSALAEDAAQARPEIPRLLHKIHAMHPIWLAVMHTSHVGAAAQALAGHLGLDMLPGGCSIQDTLGFLHEFFRCVKDNDITIARQTLEGLGNHPEQMVHRWVYDDVVGQCETSEGLLTIYQEAFAKRYGAVAKGSLQAEILGDITREMLGMQGHPDVLAERRRFVVIRASTEKDLPRYKDGMEWLEVSEFSFGDGPSLSNN